MPGNKQYTYFLEGIEILVQDEEKQMINIEDPNQDLENELHKEEEAQF